MLIDALSGFYGQLTNLGFVYFDVLPKLWNLTGNWLIRFAPTGYRGEITHSIAFVLTFMVISSLLSLPTSIYQTFVLEEKFGFNKQTPKLFVTDLLKGQALAFVLAPPILAGFLSIIQKTGNGFFFYLWAFGAGLQVFMITVYPIAILPLFNKLSPLEPGALKTGVENLAKRLEFPLSKLYVIDGSKRSAHSNAYFYGLPWSKHIVIYDTLIAKSETEEVVAVLAHELGHWSLGHTTKLFGIAQVRILITFQPISQHKRLIVNSYRPISSTSSASSPSLLTTNPSTNPSASTRTSQSSSVLSSSRMPLHPWTPSLSCS